jgi:hypothetical protein
MEEETKKEKFDYKIFEEEAIKHLQAVAKNLMLDGEYKCYENGKLKFVHTFSGGNMFLIKSFIPTGRCKPFLITPNIAMGSRIRGTCINMT